MSKKVQTNDLKLSGKGFTYSGEWKNENVKFAFEQTIFHEVIDGEDDRIGWIIVNELKVFADFTAHTEYGMKGKSTSDFIDTGLILDIASKLDILPLSLEDVDTTVSSRILNDLYSHSTLNSYDLKQEDWSVILISNSSELVFVQSADSTIRVKEDDGVYVLKRREDKDKLIMIDADEGEINVQSDKCNVSIGADGIFVGDNLVNIEDIIKQATSAVNIALNGVFSAFGPL